MQVIQKEVETVDSKKGWKIIVESGYYYFKRQNQVSLCGCAKTKGNCSEGTTTSAQKVLFCPYIFYFST